MSTGTERHWAILGPAHATSLQYSSVVSNSEAVGSAALTLLSLHQKKSTFLTTSYHILLHLITLILGVRKE